MEYSSTADCQAAGITYHLTPLEVWNAQRDSSAYVPEAYETDGFIHCSDGLELLGRAVNTFYRDESRVCVVLVLSLAQITSPVRYDDTPAQFPHVYGAIHPDAVIGELPVSRGEDGSFVAFGNTLVSGAGF